MEQRYDVFISYRRDGGESTAKILRDKLAELGYRVFFDVESLRSGDFNTKLYSVIDECSDFLLILSPNALDRCWNEDDWVRQEIERALDKGKNVIPVMLRGFSFPKELPESIEPLRYKNGLESNYQFFDAFIEKLVSFLESKPGKEGPEPGRMRSRVLVPFLIVAALAAAGAGFAFWKGESGKVYPRSEGERNLTGSLLYYVQMNLLQLEQAAGYLDESYQAGDRYLEHFDSADRSALLAELQKNRRLLNQMDLDASQLTSELSLSLQDSPFSAADAKAMHDYLEEFRDSCVDSIYYLEYLTDEEAYLDLKVREAALDNYREILAEELKAMAYGTNLLLLPVTNEEAVREFKHEFLPGLYYIPLQAANWSSDQEALTSAEDKSWNAIDKIMGRITIQIGEQNVELMKGKAELVQKYMEAGASEEEARQLVESLSGGSQLLSEKEAELQDMNQELDGMLDEARKKFAPAAEDDENTLWGKMLRFLNLGLYDEAVACVDAYREKVRDEDEYADTYCAAAIRMIRSIGRTGIDYGILVTGYEPGSDFNEQYEIGDVIVAFQGRPCHNYREYSSLKEQLGGDVSYDVVVMREKKDGSGELEQVKLTIPAGAPRVALREMSEKEYD